MNSLKRSGAQNPIIMSLCVLSLTACLPESQTGTVESQDNSAISASPEVVVIPDPVTPPIPEILPPVPPQDDSSTEFEGIEINNNDVLTTSSLLSLRLNKFEALRMKVSTNANCEGGTWVPFNPTLNSEVDLADQNRTVYRSARFSDLDGQISGCYADGITHDNLPPEILFQKYPLETIVEGTPVELIYDVQDLASGVDSVTCRFNDVERPCSAGRTVVQIAGALPGTYTMSVRATDRAGFQSERSVSWQVAASTRRITHTINIDEYRKWDILFVIDNSGSMQFEQQNMAQRTKNFLSVLRGLDWQIGITTTDPRSSAVGGDGKLLELTGRSGQYLLNSSMNEVDSQNLLSNTLQRSETGSGHEQGIRSSYRVVERAAQAGTIQSQMFRSGAHFAVVLISDEDESDNTQKNDPEALLQLLTTSFGGQKNFSFHSIITIPGDRNCISTNGYTYGERYNTLSNLTGGVIGSVCQDDYTAQVTGIAEKIRSMAKTFTLSCVPLVDRGISVMKNGVVVNETYVINGLSLRFDNPIEPGQYTLNYHCAKE